MSTIRGRVRLLPSMYAGPSAGRDTGRDQLRLIAIALASAVITKHYEVFVVGRLFDAFDKDASGVSALQHSRNIRITGHFSAHGMPDRPCVVPSACGPYAVISAARGPRFSSASGEGGPGSYLGFRMLDEGKGPQMAATSRKRRLSGEARRALELLVDQHGTNEALMFAHGFTDQMLLRLARAGLITIRREVIKTGAKTIDVGRVTITDAGRRALEGESARRPSPRLPEAR